MGRRRDAGSRAPQVWLRGPAIAAVLIVLASASARAQTPSPLAEWQYSAGVPLRNMFLPTIPTWEASVGLAGVVEPLYDGADRYRVRPGPIMDLRYRNLAFASTGEGVGVNVISGRNYRVGIALSYDFGRQVKWDRAQLNGLGNIGAAVEAKLFGEYVVSESFPLVLRLDVRRQLGGADGWIGDAGAYLPLPGSSETFQWFAGPTVTVADATYMQNYFGVGQAQSLNSGYPPHQTSAGVKSFGCGLSIVWFFAEHWFATADAAISRLAGSAADSPITQAATNAAVEVSIAYQF